MGKKRGKKDGNKHQGNDESSNEKPKSPYSATTAPKPRPVAVPKTAKPIKRTYQEELKYLTKISPTHYKIDIGFVPNMNVPAVVLVNDELEELLLEELKVACDEGGKGGGFLPAVSLRRWVEVVL